MRMDTASLLENAQKRDEYRRLLEHRLGLLKTELAIAQREVDQLHSQSSPVAGDLLIEGLLASNDALLVPRPAEKNNAIRDESDAITFDDDIFYPIRNTPHAIELLGLFHPLTFEPCSSHMVSRNSHVSEFRGFCGPKSSKRFSFFVALYVTLPQQEVASFTIKTSPWVRAEIGPFLSKMERTGNISNCFYGLAQYGNLAIKRYEVFERLSRDYQVVDSLWRHSCTIVFRPRNHFQLTLKWYIHVDDHGDPKSRPSISLNFSQRILQQDSSDKLATYQSVFTSLVESQGVYRATCAMHDILKGPTKSKR
jgi:hypothetical protein